MDGIFMLKFEKNLAPRSKNVKSWHSQPDRSMAEMGFFQRWISPHMTTLHKTVLYLQLPTPHLAFPSLNNAIHWFLKNIFCSHLPSTALCSEVHLCFRKSRGSQTCGLPQSNSCELPNSEGDQAETANVLMTELPTPAPQLFVNEPLLICWITKHTR